VPPDERYTQALAGFESLRAAIGEYNSAVAAANAIIEARKHQAEAANLSEVENELARLKAFRARHTESVKALCATDARLQNEKSALETAKTQAREQLDAHTSQVISAYGQRINHYLERVNAGFRITPPTHNYRGGTPNTSYQIVINQHPVDLGDADTPHDRPSFRNTLSAGDKSTLALAFFLALSWREVRVRSCERVWSNTDAIQAAFLRVKLRHLPEWIDARRQVARWYAEALADVIDVGLPVEKSYARHGYHLFVIRAQRRDALQAHLTHDGVKQAVEVTRKPLLLSHTVLQTNFARSISAEHARLVAKTGGVIGIFPVNSGGYYGFSGYVEHIIRMIKVVGVEHVGIGTDMDGISPPSFVAWTDYSEWPSLAAALLAQGYSREDVAKLLGGNFLRVYRASAA